MEQNFQYVIQKSKCKKLMFLQTKLNELFELADKKIIIL